MLQIALINKAMNEYRSRGLRSFLKASARFVYYHTVREYLPGKYQEIRGTTIGGDSRKIRIFDTVFGVDVRWPQTHKKPNCDLIKEYVKEGNNVTLIGGGYGITAVTAANQVGDSGRIVVYEGARSQIPPLQETIELNNVEEKVNIKHSIVGEAVDLTGQSDGAKMISPGGLLGDVIEMDCEGAEINIIKNLNEFPSRIIVETHPKKGAPTVDVEEALRDNGYEIIERREDRNSGHVLVSNVVCDD